nr:hypothetical protein Iba_chr14cCG16140 [Ipomoea batatas]
MDDSSYASSRYIDLRIQGVDSGIRYSIRAVQKSDAGLKGETYPKRKETIRLRLTRYSSSPIPGHSKLKHLEGASIEKDPSQRIALLSDLVISSSLVIAHFCIGISQKWVTGYPRSCYFVKALACPWRHDHAKVGSECAVSVVGGISERFWKRIYIDRLENKREESAPATIVTFFSALPACWLERSVTATSLITQETIQLEFQKALPDRSLVGVFGVESHHGLEQLFVSVYIYFDPQHDTRAASGSMNVPPPAPSSISTAGFASRAKNFGGNLIQSEDEHLGRQSALRDVALRRWKRSSESVLRLDTRAPNGEFELWNFS